MRICVPGVQADVILFGSVVCVASCGIVSSVCVSDWDRSVCLGLCVCGCDFPWLCLCTVPHSIRHPRV